MRRTILAVAATALFLAALPAAADQGAPGYGTQTPSGSTFTTEIGPGGDCDDYVFQGYPGMKLTASVKPSKGSALVPEILLVRPGGTLVSDEDGLRITASGNALKATMPLDATGWWQVRVRGADLDPALETVNRSAGAYSVTISYSAPSLPVLPVVTKSFTVQGAIDTSADTDAYRFAGFVGQSLTATLKKPKSSKLLPSAALFRPDGTQVTDAGVVTTNGSTTTIKFPLDQDGTWFVRVYGLEPDPDPDPTTNDAPTGAYSLSVKLGKPPQAPSLAPDANNQYRFTIPGAGGATISYSLAFKGDAPVFNVFSDPSGHVVPNVPETTTVKSFTLAQGLPLGDYTVTFDAPATPPTNVTFTAKVVPPKGAKARKAKLASLEPIISLGGVNPLAGGPGTLVVVTTNGNVIDSNDPNPTKLKMYLDHVALTDVVMQNATQLRGTVPTGLSFGTHDIVIESTAGQTSVREHAFEVVAAPKAFTIDPNVGPQGGDFDVTITGTGFRPTRMGVTIDGAEVPVQIKDVTDSSITFVAPPRAAGKVTYGVLDKDTQLPGTLPVQSFEYTSTPAINRIVPALTSVLGGDLVAITGANFTPTDHVYLETGPNTGQFEEITVLQPDDDKSKHFFIAPIRPVGTVRAYVTDVDGQPTPPRYRPLTYFSFANLSAPSGVIPSASDRYDGETTAVADFDKDGSDDLFIARLGGNVRSNTSLTRVLKNDGTGRFTDVTAGTNGVMPIPSVDDDWRADRIWVVDVTQDGYPDIVIVTNNEQYPGENKSHVRILTNEQRTGNTPNDRVFRDRTVDLMPPIRIAAPISAKEGTTGIVDNWRGLDMWIGDVDKGPVGPPEILITHNELKQEVDVTCGNYCSTTVAVGYAYAFYWGGSRAFVWNKSARGGQGRFKFEASFFPRKSGLRIPIAMRPGLNIPVCNPMYQSPCQGKFTPFTGKRIVAGNIDPDGKPDVAVLSDREVRRNGIVISSLQIGMNKFNAQDGALLTDATDALANFSGTFQGDSLAIGQPGYPNDNNYGVIAVGNTVLPEGADYAIRLIQWRIPQIVGTPIEFQDITSLVMPLPGVDHWEASRIIFRDVDQDGDQDLILEAPAAPGGNTCALRVLRNNVVNDELGHFQDDLHLLTENLVTGSDYLEGDFLSLGDVNKDGALDFVVTRATPVGGGAQTRVVITKKK